MTRTNEGRGWVQALAVAVMVAGGGCAVEGEPMGNDHAASTNEPEAPKTPRVVCEGGVERTPTCSIDGAQATGAVVLTEPNWLGEVRGWISHRGSIVLVDGVARGEHKLWQLQSVGWVPMHVRADTATTITPGALASGVIGGSARPGERYIERGGRTVPLTPAETAVLRSTDVWCLSCF